MDRVVIFGAGRAGRLAYEAFSADHLIIAFADNDAEKTGRVLLGCDIVSPTSILSMDFDRIIIASVHWTKVKVQLERMGVAREKIKIFKANIAAPASLLVTPHLDRVHRQLYQLDLNRRKSRIKNMRVILFGAGSAAKGIMDTVSRFADVICIADNDPSKHGKTTSGIEIVPAESILTKGFDYIIIASMYAGEIRMQLLSMGIEPAKIKGMSDIPQMEQNLSQP